MKGILKIIFIIIIVAVILFLKSCGGFGIGLGFLPGTGAGFLKGTADNEMHADEELKEKGNTEEISIIDDKYIYNNQEISIDELLSKLESKGSNLRISINADKATKNAFDKLVDKLDENEMIWEERKE